MSKHADALRDRLAAAAEPVLTDPHAALALRKAAALVSDAEDVLAAMGAVVPLILDCEAAAEAHAVRAKWLRRVLADVLHESGAPSIESRDRLHVASVSAGSASVIVTDEAAIPPSFKRQPPPAADKSAIAKAIKAGAKVPGAELRNGSPTLRIITRDRT